MAYKRIVNMELTEILRRYFDSQSLSSISLQSGLSRNTIRKYINEFSRRGITSYDKEKIDSILPDIMPAVSGSVKNQIIPQGWVHIIPHLNYQNTAFILALKILLNRFVF